ncbi:hypothetical protein ACWZEH_10900 [Streptomyces sp. QTS137]
MTPAMRAVRQRFDRRWRTFGLHPPRRVGAGDGGGSRVRGGSVRCCGPGVASIGARVPRPAREVGRTWGWPAGRVVRAACRRKRTPPEHPDRAARAERSARPVEQKRKRPGAQSLPGLARGRRRRVGHGRTPGGSRLAATIRRDIHLAREAAREALRDLDAQGEDWPGTDRRPCPQASVRPPPSPLRRS